MAEKMAVFLLVDFEPFCRYGYQRDCEQCWYITYLTCLRSSRMSFLRGHCQYMGIYLLLFRIPVGKNGKERYVPPSRLPQDIALLRL
jgi:hypothetical protein